ncbi:MAG: hypothetical protein E7661_02045 [Ruminococcaceae bacterium]|nr:hypothetical protein [Oscillospiraceae bacterium]
MTYVKDEMLNLASRMTDMSEDLINESDIRGIAVAKPKRERTGRFSAFMNHPAMVAVLCAVVSLGVVAAIVMAGQGGPDRPQLGGTSPAETKTSLVYAESEETQPSRETEAYPSDTRNEEQTTLPDEIILDRDVYVSYSSNQEGLYLSEELYPQRSNIWTAGIQDEIPSEEKVGFFDTAQPEQLKNLPTAYDIDGISLHLQGKRQLRRFALYDADLHCLLWLYEPESIEAQNLTAGTYYVLLCVAWETDSHRGQDEYTFAFSLKDSVERLSVPVILGDEAETAPPQEPETQPSQNLDYTAELQSSIYTLTDDTIDFTLTATKPGEILYWRNNFTLYRTEGDEEILVYQYEGNITYEGSGYASSEDEYATATGCLLMSSIRAYQKEEPLHPGHYRLYFDEKAYDRLVFVDFVLIELETTFTEPETRYEPTEQVGDYTLIPHTPTAGINDKYFKISMTATEPGKVLTASAAYRLYRLHGDEEELIHDYDVELSVYEEPASPNDYAIYETGVSLVWAKSNLEAKGDTLTPGWYRVKFGRATLDFELVDKTGATPEVHPFAELPIPVSVYTAPSTEDMALYEQYERVYTSAYKIERLWAVLQGMTVTEANPPADIRSGDNLGIHVTYPDGTKGRIFFWGEDFTYFYVDDSPWYQVPPEEAERLMTQIQNVLSDPT